MAVSGSISIVLDDLVAAARSTGSGHQGGHPQYRHLFPRSKDGRLSLNRPFGLPRDHIPGCGPLKGARGLAEFAEKALDGRHCSREAQIQRVGVVFDLLCRLYWVAHSRPCAASHPTSWSTESGPREPERFSFDPLHDIPGPYTRKRAQKGEFQGLRHEALAVTFTLANLAR